MYARMQALILSGGEGTRLRPLTDKLPKPAVPLVNRPMMSYMLDWLAAFGIEESIISCGFLAGALRDALGGDSYSGMSLRYVEEKTPLGTAGAIKLAEPYIEGRFLVLNGDVLTDLDLASLVVFHEAHGRPGTIALTPVEDPSAYGLVRTASDGRILEFVEKPTPDLIDTDLINAGAYVLEPEVLDWIEPGRKVSSEHEVFPALVEKGLLGATAVSGYWLDLGTPERYLQAGVDILEGNLSTEVGRELGDDFLYVADSGPSGERGRLVPPAVVGQRCTIEAGARVGSLAVLGDDVTVGPGAVVERAVLQDGCVLGPGTVVCSAIVAEGTTVGAHARIEAGAVVGAGCTIGDGNVLSAGVRVAPGTSLPPHTLY